MYQKRSLIWTTPLLEFKEIVTRSKSTTEVLAFFGLKNKGNNNRKIKARIKENNIDTSHFKKNYAAMVYKNLSDKKTLEEILVKDSTFNTGHLKRRLLDNGMKKNQCEICDQSNIWNGAKLTMVLDHINGESTDHRFGNLRMVCPNCNSQLATHAGRNLRNGQLFIESFL